MRTWLLPLLCCFMLFCSGCAILDALFGTNEKGEQKPSILNTIVTTALNGLFPGSGAALTAVGGLYAAYRGKKWKKAATTTFDEVEAHGDAALKARLGNAHAKAGVQKLVKAHVAKYKKPVAPAVPVA